MKEKNVIKLKLKTIIVIMLIVLIVAGVILFVIFSEKPGIFMSKSKIRKIADDYQYETKDEQLKKIRNDLLGYGDLIISKESASTLNEAQNLSTAYKNELNEGLQNRSGYESYTDFEYIDSIETTYYYKYIGEYTYKYKETGPSIEEYSKKYTFLVFKSDCFEFPYLKKNNDAYGIKEFGDILAVINYKDVKFIKSEVKDNGGSFTYNLYYISKPYSELKSNPFEVGPAVMPEKYYALEKVTFTVNKSTGKTDNLSLKNSSYQIYKDVHYPWMNNETIKSFR